jgi:DNA recombination protein RmuC
VGSLESRVLVSARKFKDLQAAPEGKEIRDLGPVETAPREIQAPEMQALGTQEKE